MLVATSMGAVFALLIPLALLTSEGKGIEYAKTLPITSQRMVSSKALITMATFVPVPFALLCLALFKPLTSWFTILIPFFMVISIVSASIFEIMIFLRSVGKSKIAGIVNDAEKIFRWAFNDFRPGSCLRFCVSFLVKPCICSFDNGCSCNCRNVDSSLM